MSNSLYVDRLLIEAAKRGAAAGDLKSLQRSINAAVFDLAESRYGSEYTSGEWAYGVNQVARRLGELLDAGQAAAVVTLAEHALAATPTPWRSWPTCATCWPASGGRATSPPTPLPVRTAHKPKRNLMKLLDQRGS